MSNPNLRTVRDARGEVVVGRRELDGQCHVLEVLYCMSIDGTRFPNFPKYISREFAANKMTRFLLLCLRMAAMMSSSGTVAAPRGVTPTIRRGMRVFPMCRAQGRSFIIICTA